MAATSFVYFKFSTPCPQKWFKDQCSTATTDALSATLSSAADTTKTVLPTSTSTAEGKLFSSHELKELASHKIKVKTPDMDISALLREIKVLLITTNEDEYYAALSYLTPPLNYGTELLQYKCYIVGQYGLFDIALQWIANFRETKDVVPEAYNVFKNLHAVFSLGVIRGVKKRNAKRLNILVSQTLNFYESPNAWSENIMYLPGQYHEEFKELLSKWPQDFSIVNRLVETPCFHLGDILCGNFKFDDERVKEIAPNADGIEIDDASLFYRHVLNHNYNLMIVKAICDFTSGKERKYQPTAALLAADCLNHLLNNDKMVNIFKHWLKNDIAVKRYLNQAKQLGYKVQLRHLTVLLVGTSGVGKTSFLAALQGKDPPKEHNPTDARKGRKVMIPNKIDIKSDDTWILLDRDKQIAEIKKRLDSKSLKHDTNMLESAHKNNTEGATLSNKDATLSNEGATSTNEDTMRSNKGARVDNNDVTASTKVGTESDEHNNAPSKDIPNRYPENKMEKHDYKFTNPSKITKSDSLYMDMMHGVNTKIDNDLLKCKVSDEPSDTWNILTIIDTAGQPEFINLLPALNKLAKITFVVFNMESKLHDKVDIKRGKDSSKEDLAKLHYSNLHAIKSLISMITHSAQYDSNNSVLDDKDKFQVCLIGTHYDKVFGDLDLIEKIESKIKEVIQQSKVNQLCCLWNFDKSKVFKIDASQNHLKHTVQGDEDVARITTEAIEAIREKINEILQKSTEHISTDISLKWLLLELLIQDNCEKNKMIYMDLKKINKLVREENLNMRPNEIDLALKHLHNTGVLLYYSRGEKGLTDIVFPNPNYLFECLTRIINIVHNCSKKALNDAYVNDLRENGILHKKLVQDLDEDLFQEKVTETLLALLEHLKIITLLPAKQGESSAESTIYFIPCVLPSYELNMDELGSTRSDKVSLHIKFKFGMIPRGLFCSLVVALRKENNIFTDVVGKTYNNLIKFQTTTENEVELLDRVSSLEILVDNGDKGNDFIYYQVRHVIIYTLTAVWKNFELIAPEPSLSSYIKYGFCCNRCRRYIVTIDNLNKSTNCQNNDCNYPMKLQNYHKVWFYCKLSLRTSGTTDTTVTLQWKLAILPSLIINSKHKLKYSNSNVPERSLILFSSDLRVVNGLAIYEVCDLSPNTTYQFKLAVVDELGIEGEYTKVEATTRKIKPEYFAYNEKDLKDSVSEVIKKINTEEFILPEDNAQQDCDKVQLLLMTVNDNEFHAALHHMAKKHIKNRNLEDSDIPKSFMVDNENEIYYFYIGNFADIPTALVKHKQGSSESQKLASVAMKIFLNLKAIVAVGVCGTFGELGHVIVSSEIVTYQHDDKDKSIQSSSQVLFNFLQAPGNWEFNCYNDSSQDKYLSQSYFKPFLCPSTPEAYHKFEDKIRENICEDAMGIEMEGSGIIKAKGDDVHFIIVKSGCKYANDKVTEAWEPVAAMAATSFVYFKFSTRYPQKWFKDQCSTATTDVLSTTLSSAADTTITVLSTSTSIAEGELLDTERKLELQKEVFTNCRQYIVQYLSPDDIVDHLISKHLIGDSARQELSLPKTTKEKNRIIVDELCSGGPDTFKKFCVILKENSRTKHIADRLEKEWRRLLESSQNNSEQLQHSTPVHTKITKEKNLVQPDQLEAWAHKNPFDWISPTDKDTKLMRENTQILLVTANKHEYNAVLTLLEPVKNSRLLKYKHCYNIGPLRKTATYIFGKFGAFNAAVHTMESQGPAAAQDVIPVAASCFGYDLNAIIAVGVACGVDKRNDYLDVLVSEKVTFYQYARYGTSDKDKLKITNRDIANLPTSSFLRDLFKQPPQWPTNENGGTVAKLAKKPVLRLGTILSGNKLVDNKKFKEELLENFSPEAIGIEMEGAGLYHNYNDHNYEILVVKGVCDFGDGKKDKKYQPTAALLAAECVKHYLSDDHLPQSLRIHCINGQRPSQRQEQQIANHQPVPVSVHQQSQPTEHSKYSTDDTNEQQPLTEKQKLESTDQCSTATTDALSTTLSSAADTTITVPPTSTSIAEGAIEDDQSNTAFFTQHTTAESQGVNQLAEISGQNQSNSAAKSHCNLV